MFTMFAVTPTQPLAEEHLERQAFLVGLVLGNSTSQNVALRPSLYHFPAVLCRVTLP